MKHKASILKALRIVAIVLAVYCGIALLFPTIIGWMSKPVRIDNISQGTCEKIEERFHIMLPEAARFVVHFSFPGRDSTDVYVFELDLVGKNQEESTDAYLRRMLSVNSSQYKATFPPEADDFYSIKLAEVGLAYTSLISPREASFDEIRYRVINNKIEVAIIWG